MNYDNLLEMDPYSLPASEKEAIYRELLSGLTDHHRKCCAPYDRVCRLLGDIPGSLRDVDQIPMVPVSLFKNAELSSIPQEEIFKTVTSSGTTGQRTSKIFLDRRTAAWQQRTLEKIVSSQIGRHRLPMLIIDSPAVLKDRDLFSARGAGILGFSIFGSKRQYALNEKMELDYEAVLNFLTEHAGKPLLVFGFTYMIWQHFYKPLRDSGRTLTLENGFLIHGGGWKKLSGEAVSPDCFQSSLTSVCGLKKIRNYYGMAEQTGCIYMECECGHLHASIYSDIRIRDMEDFSVCPPGREGVIQVLSPMAWSYPGHSILTEDQGILLGEDTCPCGRKGKYFKITGRIPAAEVRGCSDTYEP